MPIEREKYNFIKPMAPVLALLGDICCCGSDNDFETFKKFIYLVDSDGLKDKALAPRF